jgi:hypothetical protein
MDVFLEVASRLSGADAGNILDWRLEKSGNVQLDLLAQTWVFQSLAKVGLLNVGETATERTFHNIVIHHCRASWKEGRADVPLSTVPAVLLEDWNASAAVTIVASKGDGSHSDGSLRRI